MILFALVDIGDDRVLTLVHIGDDRVSWYCVHIGNDNNT